MNEIYPRSHTFGVNPLLFVIFQHRISHSSISMLALSSLLPPPLPSFPLFVGNSIFESWSPWKIFQPPPQSPYSPDSRPLSALHIPQIIQWNLPDWTLQRWNRSVIRFSLKIKEWLGTLKSFPTHRCTISDHWTSLRHLRFNIFFRSYFFFAFLQDEPPW